MNTGDSEGEDASRILTKRESSIQGDFGVLQLTHNYSQDARDVLVQALRTMQGRLDQRIATFKEKGLSIPEKDRFNWDLKVSQLENRSQSLSALIEAAGKSNELNWATIQESAKQNWDEVSQTMRDSASPK